MANGQTARPQSSSSSRGTTKARKGRGRTQGKMLASLPEGVKLTIEFDDHNRPIGRHISDYATMQGLVIRDKEITPLGYKSWHEVPGENKYKMVQEVLKKFEIGDGERRVKYLVKSLGKKWREYRCELKRAYDRRFIDAEKLQNLLKGVYESDWRWLVDHWGGQAMKELSMLNKQRRAQQKMLHCTGRRSFAEISDKKEKSTGVEPSRLEVFDLAYRRSDGTFLDPVAEQKAEEISRLKREREQGLNSYSDEDIFRQVFGRERDGRVRCIGYVLTPTIVLGRQGRSKVNFEDPGSPERREE